MDRATRAWRADRGAAAGARPDPLGGAGAPGRFSGKPSASFGEALTLIASGKGVFPVGEHAARFYPRPDIAYIPLQDAPPIRWAPVGLTANSSQRIREFVRAAKDATTAPPPTD
nr:hypothetical protein [Actinomadura sp. CNU-125]